MRIEYTHQSLADLREIAADSRAFGDQAALAVEKRILKVVTHIAQNPEAAESVAERPGIRVGRLFAIDIRFSTESSKIAA